MLPVTKPQATPSILRTKRLLNPVIMRLQPMAGALLAHLVRFRLALHSDQAFSGRGTLPSGSISTSTAEFSRFCGGKTHSSGWVDVGLLIARRNRF